MRRLFFLVPDLQICHQIVDELKAFGIAERHIHVIGSQATPLEDLNPATLMQTTDLAHGLEGGLAVGGAAGLIGGLLAVSFPPAGLVLGGGALLATTMAGAGFGALVSSLVAKDMPNKHLLAYERAIMEGRLLVIADIPRSKVDDAIELIRQHHSDADIQVAIPAD